MSGTLRRAQIYIEEIQMRQLKLEAQREHLAVSELIRKAIEQFLGRTARRTDWDKDPLTQAIGKIKLSVNDASAEHDRYLYGRRRRD